MTRAPNPYSQQPDRAFWRKTVQDVHPLDIGGWYQRKFDIGDLRIAAAGSCFAQHIGREMKAKGFRFLDVEPPPLLLQQKHWLDFGYGMYSARYGNIYTTRQLLQLAKRAIGEFVPADVFWASGSGFVDPFRPTIEPRPLASIDEVVASREDHLKAVMQLFEKTEIFVFTLGLAEAWVSKADGAVFPVAPGVAGGEFDPARHEFVNLTFEDCMADLREFLGIMRGINRRMKFLFTVSPVPLMATASGEQVVVAASYSKAVLRAVAGQLANSRKWIDYFPSYEIISSHVMNGQFYLPDRRGVSQHGVDHVMRQFFKEHVPPARVGPGPAAQTTETTDDVFCDEELLNAPGGSVRA